MTGPRDEIDVAIAYVKLREGSACRRCRERYQAWVAIYEAMRRMGARPR